MLGRMRGLMDSCHAIINSSISFNLGGLRRSSVPMAIDTKKRLAASVGTTITRDGRGFTGWFVPSVLATVGRPTVMTKHRPTAPDPKQHG